MKIKAVAYECTLTETEAERHPHYVTTKPITVTEDEDGWFAEVEDESTCFHPRLSRNGWTHSYITNSFKTAKECFSALRKGER